MRFHFAGKFDGNPESLPTQRQAEGAVMFKEPAPEKLGLIANALSFVVIGVLVGVAYLRCGSFDFVDTLGIIASVLILVPHEFLHALCFKEDVYMYTYLQQGMLFVIGDEDMSKARFVFMSLLPNIVFGFIPFLIFLIYPSAAFFASLGILAIGGGTGDYINVINALTQVPKGAKIYMYRMNSFWYLQDAVKEQA